jgi:hypothetical protein
MSSRYGPVLCVLVAVALVPTVLHRYVGAKGADGRLAAAIPVTLAGAMATPSARDQGWGERRFQSRDWFEREYRLGPQSVRLTVLRSYDLKRLYHHPELDVAYGVPFVSHRVATLAADPQMPVHVLETGPSARGIAMYALLYDGRFIDDPLRFQVRLAGELLVRARQPMTLFFALDPDGAHAADLDAQPAGRILHAAVREFIAQSPAAPR